MSKSPIITNDNQIVLRGEIVGYIEDDVVYIFERGVSRKLGAIDHRAEAVKLVYDWSKNRD